MIEGTGAVVLGQGFDVRSEALRTYARATEQDVERIERIRNRVDQLDVSEQAFGMLPQSDEMKTDYDEKQRGSAVDLGSAAEKLRYIVDTVRETADAYDRNDEDVASGFQGH